MWYKASERHHESSSLPGLPAPLAGQTTAAAPGTCVACSSPSCSLQNRSLSSAHFWRDVQQYYSNSVLFFVRYRNSIGYLQPLSASSAAIAAQEERLFADSRASDS